MWLSSKFSTIMTRSVSLSMFNRKANLLSLQRYTAERTKSVVVGDRLHQGDGDSSIFEKSVLRVVSGI